MNFNPAEFANPSAAWRGKPFWSWNGKLDKDELIRQIHVLKEMGMGGFFMHSRTGLVTEYLGQEWFDLINACAEEGQRLGMEGWLYDEDRWPSGTAGGMVTANPEYRMKFIHLQRFDADAFDLAAWRAAEAHPLGAWSCRLENGIDVYDLAPVTDATPPADLKGKTVLAFRIIPMTGGSFYNGNTYVDTLKREATEAYIRITHEAYKKHCGQHFGGSIKGIFTDEPHRGPLMSGFGTTRMEGIELTDLVPWTEALFDTFARTHGTRIESQLPALFLRENGQPITALKAQFAETVLSMFLDNFARPCLEWCEANNLILTGHVLHENSLSCQVSTIGSVMRYYPLMHWPGIDYLGEGGRDYWVAKQVDSAARQYGQPWILSELYGCTGWQMNFEAHKAVGAWQALFGVNVRCHHLCWYTMEGESKRDYPASIFYQSPWYREYARVETWFSRLGYFRSLGQPCCDLLVINPVESVWARVYPGAIRGMQTIDKGIRSLESSYAKLFHILAGNQIDFDYGDEGLLAEVACVETRNGTPVLRVGKMEYTTAIVAGADSIRGTTLSLLSAFALAGGRVVLAGDDLRCVDAVCSHAIQDLPATRCAFSEEAIIDALANHSNKHVRITDRASGQVATQVFCQLRAADDGHYLTVLNSNRDQPCDVWVELSGIEESVVEEWDLERGDARRVPTRAGEGLAFSTSLSTSQVRCFRIAAHTDLAIEAEVRREYGEWVELDQSVPFTLAEKNVCVLDLPSWSLNGGRENAVDDILRIDRKVREQLGVPVRAGDMVQPWFRGKTAFPVLGELVLRYPFHIDPQVLATLANVQLVVETPQRFRIRINGVDVDSHADDGWWIDPAFRRLRLPAGVFKAGANQIVVSCAFSEDINLEALYLVGDFGVQMRQTTPHLVPLPTTLAPRSAVEQGLPFYSGAITYHYELPANWIGAVGRVEVPAYEGACLRVSSADQSHFIPWRPNVAELALGPTLDIEVITTRKNTFGPLHLKNPRPGFTGPGQFVPGDTQFRLDPTFIDSGLLAPPRVQLLSAGQRGVQNGVAIHAEDD